MGMIRQHGHRQFMTGCVTIGTRTQAKVDHLCRWQGGLEHRASVRRERLGQADKDLPVMQCTLRLGQDGAIEACDIAYREQIEGGVVVIVFQRRGGGQDQVGITRGLVDIQVDADHELQPVQGLFQLAAVRRGQYRVAGHRHQGADLPFTLGQHFFGQG